MATAVRFVKLRVSALRGIGDELWTVEGHLTRLARHAGVTVNLTHLARGVFSSLFQISFWADSEAQLSAFETGVGQLPGIRILRGG